MLPSIPVKTNSALTNQVTIGELQRISLSFGPNLVDSMPEENQRSFLQWMRESYVWQRLVERRQMEELWDNLYDMSRAVIKKHKLLHPSGSRMEREGQRARKSIKSVKKIHEADVADTLIFDAIDRLTNINHFISFKEALPAKYQKPPFYVSAAEQPNYAPIDDIYRTGNCILDWNSTNQKVFLKHSAVARQHYTYGTSFVHSDYTFKVKPTKRRRGGQYVDIPEIHDIGVTFDPISIRKVWLDFRIPIWQMNKQPCVFFYDYCHPYELQQNIYDSVYNPTGFSETQIARIAKGQYVFTGPEVQSAQEAFNARFPGISLNDPSLSENKLSLKWRFYVMAPIDLNTGVFNADGSVPYSRFIVETYGPGLQTGEQVILRIQHDYHPDDELPIYGSTQYPDVDSGAYSLSIGEVLESHYNNICTIMDEFLINKKFNNDPPTTFLAGSPSLNKEVNEPGAKITVNSHKEMERAKQFEGTQTSLTMLRELKEQGQTSSKAVDAILGKAMGARTSATEAEHVFQTAMSGVTTDINIFNYMIMGGYADRVWRYIGLWMPDSIVKSITGSLGFELKPENFELRLGLKTDIGSTFIESITRQQNLRYVLEASRMSPDINGPEIWRMLLEEMKFENVQKIVNDGGHEYQVRRASEEAFRAYRGEMVMISPDADHQTAIRIKIAFIEDRDSVWNTSPEFARNLPLIQQQIQQHQLFLQIQMQQQLLLQQMQNAAAMAGAQEPAQQQVAVKESANTPGQLAQQNG